MANCLPFNAVKVDGKFDRVYKAEDWAWYFATFLANGVFPKPGDGLQVTAYDKMEVKVNIGYAFINGYAFRNPASHSITLSTAEGAHNRVDRVVIRWDLPQKDIYLTVLKGAPSIKPVAVALTRNTEIWELAIADIYVGKGVTRIQQKDITDQRFNSALCGIVKGTVEEIDASTLTKQFNDFFNTYRNEVLEKYGSYVQEITSYIDGIEAAGNEKLEEMKETIDSLSQLGQEKYDSFKAQIGTYIAALKSKGDTDLAEITQQLLDFRNEHEEEWIAWFDRIKEIFATNPTGAQQLQIDAAVARIEDVEEMLLTGTVAARLEIGDGDYLTDDAGNQLLVSWPICQCGRN